MASQLNSNQYLDKEKAEPRFYSGFYATLRHGWVRIVQRLDRIDIYFAEDPKRGCIALGAMLAGYILLFVYICISRYYALSVFSSPDLTIFSQSLWTSLKGEFFNNTVEAFMAGHDQLSHWGFHNQPLLFLFLPIYWLWPSPLVLLLTQVVVIPFGGVAVYFLTKRYVDSTAASLCLAIAYLMHPSYVSNLLSFHPVTFALLFIPAAIYFFDSDRWLAAWICVALVVICKENMALVGAFFGLYVIFKYRAYKAGIIACFICALWFDMSINYVIPHFRGSSYQYVDRYSEWGASMYEIFINFLTRPDRVFLYLFEGNRLYYILELLLPFLFLPLLAPETILAVPIVAQNVLSSFAGDRGIRSRYIVAIVAVLICSTIIALRRYKDKPGGRERARLYCVAIAVFMIAVYSPARGPWVPYFFKPSDTILIEEFDVARKMVSANDSISVHCRVSYFFCNRPKVFPYPINCLSSNKVLVIKDKPIWPKEKQHARFLRVLKNSNEHEVLYDGKKLILFGKKASGT